jgi:ABC-type bacteriocin/lantibiotic exporter with double-glycine peptidase domain
MRLNVPLIRQPNEYVCGPSALQMTLKYFGKASSIPTLCKLASTTERSGTSRANMVKALRNLGLKIFAKHHASTNDIQYFLQKGLPVIVNYQDSTMSEGHYGVIVGFEKGKFVINDPYEPAPVLVEPKNFEKRWYGYHKTQFSNWLLAVSDKPLPQR